ncbi:cupin domain-containing protein [candidate division WWE3 bacterium CG08_land_8_20_14_0_20_40_13]|uniref:Cupin domain-containing protein n=1 Tax=candidate division WWE3 bacterium CG08_land_8_20_14_0_20_40_13 TaxID=1975084 RepID=A0A2H0XEQ3_UNCKA|nr:MAG: cupin domain-containing protein [candidate division WWE3 bacterium CG08_land_8_20_14_0_20_40_13]
MTGFVQNIEETTLENDFFRKVLFTGTYCQLVVMSLAPGEDIGAEVHETVDQFFRVESGVGKIVMGGEESQISDGFAIVVPAGVEHNLINTSQEEPLKLYTIYSPPNHPANRVHRTKAEALADETH